MLIGVDVSRTQKPVLTGTERYTFEVVKRLTTLRPEMKWRLYSDRAFHARWSTVANGVERRIIPARLGTLWTHLTLASDLARMPVDCMFFPGTAIPFTYRRPVITTIHDIVFLTHPHLYSERTNGGWKRQLISWLVKFFTGGRFDGSEVKYQHWAFNHALQYSTGLITVSEQTRQAIEHLVVKHPPIEVVPLGVDPQGIDPKQAEMNIPTIKKPYFLYVGRLERKKNIERLIGAYASYRNQAEKPWSLVLVGQPGLDWEIIRARHMELVTAGDMIVLTNIDDAVRETLYQSARAVLLVSEAEGFGLPPFEAALRRIPVIASPCGAIPEHFGNTYERVDPLNTDSIAQAMQFVQSHEAIVQARTAEAYRRVSPLTWDLAAQKTAILFDRLLLNLKERNGIITPL